MDIILIQGKQSFKAVEVCTSRVDTLLLQVICQDIQHHILPGDDELRRFILFRSQQGGMGVNVLDRPGGMLVPGTGDIGIHIILSKANLAPDFIGMNLAPVNQIVYGGFADMENVSHLLCG